EAMRRELDGAPFVLGGFADFGRWRIVLLDSCLPGSASGALSAQALAGLEKALSSAGARHCLVCLHHHPVPMGSRWLDRVGLTNAAEFLHVIDQHTNVRAIVWGHVHQSHDALRKGVRLLATPSTCAHLLPAEDAVLPQGFDRAYADSSKLVMELDLGKLDPLEAAGWMIEHAALPAGTTLRGILGEQRYSRVSAAAAELGLAVELLDGQAPWAVGVELADLEFLHQGFDPEQGVEQQLVRRTHADGKPTAGLETLGEELGSLEALASEDQMRFLDQTVSELKRSQQELE